MIQIAGVIDIDEALMLCNQGVDYIGFPLRLKDGREDLSEEDARFIIKIIKNKTNPVLITYLDNAREIIEVCNYLDVKIIQLHGKIEESEIEKIKNISPEIKIIKSIIVKYDNFADLSAEINTYSKYADFFITDTFDAETGRTGATGKTHNWETSRKIVELSATPVILAGGLNPENVRGAILKVKPAGVDSHTGVENSDKRKDAKLVNMFVSKARKGFNDISNGY